MIDEDTKMILAYHVGGRDTENAIEFMQDPGKRIVGKFKISTDEYKPYVDAVLEAFSRKQVQHVRTIKELGIKEDRDGMKYTHMISGSLEWWEADHACDGGEQSDAPVQPGGLGARDRCGEPARATRKV